MRTFIPKGVSFVPDHAGRVFEGVIFEVFQWQQEIFNGNIETFEMVKRPDTVQIIAVHDGNIILSKERQPHTDTFLTIPAGRHDNDNENELLAAKRELKEETGYVFKNWKLIEARQAGSRKIEQIVYLFLATELEEIVEQELDDGEQIEVMPVSFEKLKALKDDPMMRFYPSLLGSCNSLEELLALPSLHDYGAN